MGSAVCGNRVKGLVISPGLSNHPVHSYVGLNEIILKGAHDNIEDLTILELSIRCTNLFSDNRFQLLNPVAYIFAQDGSNYVKKAETEVVPSTLNPFFQQGVRVAFSLKHNFSLKIEIHESQAKKPTTLIGFCIFNMHELAAHGDIITKELINRSKRTGNISILAKELKFLNDVVSIKWEYLPLKPEKNYCMLRISRLFLKECTPVYQTESRKAPYGNNKITWKKVSLSIGRACNGDETRELLVEVLDLDNNCVVIGSVIVSLEMLKSDSKKKQEVMLNHRCVGHLLLNSFGYSTKNTFLDYIHSGIEISPIYAIDFSEYLGHTDTNINENIYLSPINEIQSVLQYYQIDPLYPVFGTGANFAGESVSNCFALTGNIFQPEVVTHGMLQEYYKTTLGIITPSSKAIFGEVIEIAMRSIQYEINEMQKYYVLALVSAADPHDIDEILETFKMVAELPLSIILVKITNDLIEYTNLPKLTNFGGREFLVICNSSEIENAMSRVEIQMIEYARYKKIEISTKVDKTKVFRTSSAKLSPDKLKVRNGYFAQWKLEVIEQMKNNGRSIEEIDEISQVGVPFMAKENTKAPLSFRSRSKTLKQRSLRIQENFCDNCKKIATKLEESPCGCKSFCSSCVKNTQCTKCSRGQI